MAQPQGSQTASPRACPACAARRKLQSVAASAPESQGGSHLSGIYARNPLAIPISSSQLISRNVAATRLCAVLGPIAVALLLVQVRKIGNGTRMLGGGVGRRAHSNSVAVLTGQHGMRAAREAGSEWRRRGRQGEEARRRRYSKTKRAASSTDLTGVSCQTARQRHVGGRAANSGACCAAIWPLRRRVGTAAGGRGGPRRLAGLAGGRRRVSGAPQQSMRGGCADSEAGGRGRYQINGRESVGTVSAAVQGCRGAKAIFALSVQGLVEEYMGRGLHDAQYPFAEKRSTAALRAAALFTPLNISSTPFRPNMGWSEHEAPEPAGTGLGPGATPNPAYARHSEPKVLRFEQHQAALSQPRLEAHADCGPRTHPAPFVPSRQHR